MPCHQNVASHVFKPRHWKYEPDLVCKPVLRFKAFDSERLFSPLQLRLKQRSSSLRSEKTEGVKDGLYRRNHRFNQIYTDPSASHSGHKPWFVLRFLSFMLIIELSLGFSSKVGIFTLKLEYPFGYYHWWSQWCFTRFVFLQKSCRLDYLVLLCGRDDCDVSFDNMESFDVCYWKWISCGCCSLRKHGTWFQEGKNWNYIDNGFTIFLFFFLLCVMLIVKWIWYRGIYCSCTWVRTRFELARLLFSMLM